MDGSGSPSRSLQRDSEQQTSRDTASVPSASESLTRASREDGDDGDDGNHGRSVDALSALQESLLESVVDDENGSVEAVTDLGQNDSLGSLEEDSTDHTSSDSSLSRIRPRGLQRDSVASTSALNPSSEALLVNGDDFIANLTEVELQSPVRRREVSRPDGEEDDGDDENEVEEGEEEDEEDDIGEDEDLSDAEGADASEPLSPFVTGEAEGAEGTDRRTILRELRAWTTRMHRMHQGADEEETREEEEEGMGDEETVEVPSIQGNLVSITHYPLRTLRCSF